MASNDIVAISVGLGGLNIIVGIAIRGNIELTRSLLSTSDGHDVAVDDGVGGSTNSGVIGLTRLRSGVDSDLAEVNQSGGAVNIGDVRLSNAGTVRSVASPPDGVDDAVAGSGSDLNVTDEVVVLIEEPGVVLGGAASLIEDELDSIIIDSASNIVLLVVPVDDALSAVNRSGLGNDLGILVGIVDDLAACNSRVVSSVGVQQNVITLDVAVVGIAASEGQSGRSNSVRDVGIIDREGDGGRSLDVTLSIIGDVSNVGDLGEEGVDHDDNVIIFSRPNTRRISRFPVVAAKICKS